MNGVPLLGVLGLLPWLQCRMHYDPARGGNGIPCSSPLSASKSALPFVMNNRSMSLSKGWNRTSSSHCPCTRRCSLHPGPTGSWPWPRSCHTVLIKKDRAVPSMPVVVGSRNVEGRPPMAGHRALTQASRATAVSKSWLNSADHVACMWRWTADAAMYVNSFLSFFE